MKTHVRILFGTLLMAMASSGLFANSGIFGSFIVLNANNSGNTFYDLQGATDNPDFQNTNLGSFSCDNTLVLNGGENKTFKNGTDDITGGTLFYRVYLQNTTAGSFIPIGLNFFSNLGDGGDQIWQTANANINLLNGLTGGTYVLEVYTTASFTFDTGSGTHVSNNGGAYYTAIFSVGTPSVSNITGGFCKNTASISLDAAGVATVTLGDVYNGLFDGCGDVVVTFVPPTFGCDAIGFQTVEVTATDGAGNSAVCNATVNIVFERNPDGSPLSGCGCAPGQFVSIAESGNVVSGASCLPCPAGFECDGQDITTCPPGTFSTGGAVACEFCPAGTFQPDFQATSATACLPCEEGSTSGPGATECTPDDECGPGFYQLTENGITTCTICPPGSYCPDGENIFPCAAGTFNGQEGQIACAVCPPGRFSSEEGQTACLLCPAGKFQDAPGQTACIDCELGTANSEMGQTSCTPCPAGSFSNTSGQVECSLCPVGTFQGQTGAAACLDCEEGSFSNAEGSTSCETCPEGYFQSTADGVTTCTICPPGSYCPDGIVSIPCAAGQFSGISGAIACVPCEAGTFSSEIGATACASCPVGTFQSEAGQTECQACPAGTANNQTGQTACAACPPGTFSSENGAEVCELCPLGQYQGISGQTSCLSCPVGTANDQLGQVACAECPPGSFSGLEGQTECSLCPAGTFQDQSGAIECQPCEDGSSSGQGSTFCTNCPADQVLPLNDDCVAIVPDLTEEIAILLASPADFSGEQGQVWEYGMYPFAGYASYAQLPNWTGFVWNNPGTNLGFPQLDANGGHPELDDAARMAVRRWVSTVAGTVRVFGDFFDRNTECGDGVNVRIYINGVQFYEYLNVPGSSVAYSQIIDVAVGDNIDFVIDRKFDGGCDDTHFINNVEQIIDQSQSPQAGTIITETTIVTVTTLVHGNATICEVELTLDEAPGALMAICNENVTVFLDDNGNGTLSPSDVNNGSTVGCGDFELSLDRTSFTCDDLTGIPGPSLISELFISEYVEGSSNNKCVEIYNGTGTEVDLSDYAVNFYFNGSNSSGLTIDLVGTIQNNSTHVVCQASADAGLLTLADQTNGSGWYNGDDAVALTKNGANIDVIGQIGFDPGTEWGSGLTSTADNTIRRKSSILQGDANGSDPFDPSIEWDGFANNTFDGLGTHTVDGPNLTAPLQVQLTVTDGNGNTATCTSTVSVVDNIDPIALCQDVTVYLDENGVGTLTAEDVNNESSDNCGIESLSIDVNSFGCGDIGPQPVVLTVTDLSGNTTTCNATATVVDNLAPELNCSPVVLQLGADGTAILETSDVATATDNCGTVEVELSQTLFTCENLPTPATATDLIISEYVEGSGFEKYIEIFNGTGSDVDLSSYTLRLYANGNTNPTTTNALSGILQDGEVVVLRNSSATAYTGVSVIASAVNFNGDDAIELYNTETESSIDIFGKIGEDPGVQWNQGGNSTMDGTLRRVSTVITGNTNDAAGFPSLGTEWTSFPNNDVSGLGAHSIVTQNFVTITATDGNGNTAQCIANVTVEDNVAPTVVCQNATVQLGADGTASIAPESLVASSSDNCGTVTFTLSQAAFDCNDLGENTVTVTANDGNGNSAQCTATVTVEDNVAPTVVCQNATVQLDANGTASITSDDLVASSSDNCGPVTITLSQTAFDCSNLGPNTVTVTANDGNGNTATCEAFVTVQDGIAPTVVCQNATVQLAADGTASIAPALLVASSSDNCGTVTFTLSQTGFDCSDLGTNAVTVTANDGNGNTATCEAFVTVQDGIAPTVVCQNATVQLDANGTASIAPALLVASSSDNCGTVTFILSQTAFDCSDLGPNTVTVTANDGNGNSASCEATVAVEDNIAPIILCNNLDISLDENGSATVTVENLDAGSSDNCSLAFLEIGSGKTQFDCDDVGETFEIELIGGDGSGNPGSCTAEVTILPSVGNVDPCEETETCIGIESIVNPEETCSISGSFSGGWFNANQGTVYCFDGAYNGGHIFISNGSTVRLSGSGTIGVTVGYNATLEVLDGADITFSSLAVNWGANGMVVYPGAHVNYDGTFAPGSDVVNCGEFIVKRLQVNFNGSFTNNGLLHVYDQSVWTGIHGDFINNNETLIDGKLALYYTGSITNNCSIIIDGDLFVHRDLDNYSFVEVGGCTKVFFTGRINQFDGAMFETESTIIIGKYTGSGAPSLVKVLDETLAFWTGRIEGALFYCDENGLELVIGSNLFQNGAQDNCNLDIDISVCIPRGHVGFAKSNLSAGKGKGDDFDISEFAHLLEDVDMGNGELPADIEMTVWPNPTRGNSLLSISETNGDNLLLELYDTNGRLIQKLFDGKTMANQPFTMVLDLNSIENGLYYIRAISGQSASTLRLVNAK